MADGWRRSTILPVSVNHATGEWRLDFPELAMSAWNGFSAPYRALNGEFESAIDPETGSVYYPGMVEAAMDMAGTMAPGSIAGNSANPLAINAKTGEEALASRSARIYDPPVKPPRSFEADYPSGTVADAQGRLTRDIEGRPLGARYVVGRQVSGGGDVALPAEELASVAQGSAGARITDVAPRALRTDVGRLVKTTNRRSGNSEYEILIRRGLNNKLWPRVAGHEVSHLIDDLAGRIDVKGFDAELRTIYNDLNNPQNYGRRFGPEQHGYNGADIPRELMAEALRAYMTDPNYIKTVAPKVAERIRSAVNDSPSLRDTIQFNAGGMPGAGVGRENEQGRIRGPYAQGHAAPGVSTGPFMDRLLRLSPPER